MSVITNQVGDQEDKAKPVKSFTATNPANSLCLKDPETITNHYTFPGMVSQMAPRPQPELVERPFPLTTPLSKILAFWFSSRSATDSNPIPCY
jgi:hypothetical protein